MSGTVTIPVIGHRIGIRFQIANQIEKRVRHFSEWKNRLEALGPRPVLELHKAGDASFRVSVPEPPFGALELGKRMVTDRSIGDSVYAFGKLLEILKLHADVKPVQHMFSLWRQQAMNGPQTSVAIGKDSD